MYRRKQLIVAIGLLLFWICACTGTAYQAKKQPAQVAMAKEAPGVSTDDNTLLNPSSPVQGPHRKPVPNTEPNLPKILLAYEKNNRKVVVETDRPVLTDDQLSKLSPLGTPDLPEPVVVSRPSTARPSKKRTSAAGSENSVVLNFDDAELYEVIRTVADILGLNYMVDAAIQGMVTIHTAGSISKDQLFPIFNEILSTHNMVLVLENGLYHVRPAKDMPRLPLSQAIGKQLPRLGEDENQIIQIIPLRHISTTEMTKLIQPFLSLNSSVITHEDSNALIVVDNLAAVEKVLRLVDVFDIDIFSKVRHRVYPLQYTGAVDTAKIIESIFKAYGRAGYLDFSVIAIESMNALLVVSSDSIVFDRVEYLIDELDITTEAIQPRIYVYSVKNGDAANLTQLLNAVFGRKGKDVERFEPVDGQQTAPDAPVPVDIFGKTKVPQAKRPDIVSGGTAGTETGATGTLKGEIKITSDEIRNALIIQAIPSDYQIIQGILRKIDVMPRQVLIEVLLAEISLDESTELGVEWQAFQSLGNPSTRLLSAAAGAGGLAYTIGQADVWKHTLTALATENKVNILASPSVLASDNTAANINISTEIPVASTAIRQNTSSIDVVETTIQYRNTGIILDVTPHINERGLVSMEVDHEISEQGDGVEVAGQTYPSFRKRTVSTSLTVNDGQTIVIGGLMQESSEKGDSGIPFFSKIPLIGWLVGHKSKSVHKTELIIMITPRVIVNSDDIDHITREFKTKVKAFYDQ